MDRTWKEGSFVKIMRSYKNKVPSAGNAVAAGDILCSFLWRALKEPDNMTHKAFKACFVTLMKLYKDLDAKYELTIGNRE